MSDRQHPEAIVEYDDDSYVTYDGSTGGGHPLGEWAEVWLSFYDADGNRTERVYRAKDKLPLGWEAAPDLYEVAKAYEQWEADLIMNDRTWADGVPCPTQEQWDRLIEIQAMRNAALLKVSPQADALEGK